MKIYLTSTIACLGLVAALASPGAHAAGFVSKVKTCPGVAGLLPAGARYEIQDLIFSSSDASTVRIYWTNPEFTIVQAYMDANESVTVNLAGQIESEGQNAMKVSCTGTGDVSVTIVGREVF